MILVPPLQSLSQAATNKYIPCCMILCALLYAFVQIQTANSASTCICVFQHNAKWCGISKIIIIKEFQFIC